MSDDTTKVKELPQDEQDALITEGKAYNIPGILPELLVDDLKQKIAAAKAETETISVTPEVPIANVPVQEAPVETTPIVTETPVQDADIPIQDTVTETNVTESTEDDSHDEVDVVNPYKTMGYQAVKAEVLTRGLQIADMKGATLEAALIADDAKNAIPELGTPVADATSKDTDITEPTEIKYDGICPICITGKVFNGICNECGRTYN